MIGCLYRPSQDCSRSYGERITLNRVLKLTPEEFEEEQAGSVEPFEDGPYPDGIHTIAGVGEMTVVDGMRKTFIGVDPSMWVHKLRRIFTGE